MPDTIEQQLMWCNRARMILAATSGKKQKSVIKFDSELTNVQIALDQLIEMAGESTPVVAGFISELDAIALQASGLRDVGDPKYAGTKGQKKLREEAKAITTQLETLGKKIKASKPAKAILEARQRFFDNCNRARSRLKELGSQEKSDTTEVEELLAFIETAEQSVRSEEIYQQPAECDKATRIIAEWLGRLTLKMEQSAKDERQLDEAQSRAKPLVEDKVGAARRALAEAQTSGQLTPEIQLKLETTLQSIEQKTAAGLWTDALVLCKELPTAAQCKKAYLLTKRTLTENFRDELLLCENALTALGLVLETSAMEQERAKYNQLIARGGKESLSTKEVTLLRGGMNTLIEAWGKKTLALTGEKNKLDTAISDLRTRVERRKGLVSLPEEAENGRQLDLVIGLRDQLMFASGNQTAETLGRQLTAQRPALEQGRTWRKAATGAPQLVIDLGTWVANANLAPQLKAHAERLCTALSPATIERLTRVRDWTSLLLSHTQAEEFLAGAAKNVQTFTDFNTERGTLSHDMEPEWAKVEQACADFEKLAREKSLEPGPLLVPGREKLARIKGAWESWLGNATAADPGKVTAAKNGVAALVIEIKALGDAKTLEAESLRQAEEQAHQRFNIAKYGFETRQLDALMSVDVVAGNEMRKRLNEIAVDESLDEPGLPWDGRRQAVIDLSTEANTATGEARGRLQRLNQTLVQAVAAYKLKLTALREAMKNKGLDLKKFAPLLTSLETDIANLEVLTTTDNFTAAGVNNRLLGKLGERLDNLKTYVTNTSTFEDYTSTLERDREAIEQLKTDGLDTAAPDKLKALKEQLATLETDLYAMQPGPAAEAMRSLALAIDEARRDLQVTQTQIKQAKLAANDCAKRVAVFAKKGVADAYRKSLEARVAAARKSIESSTELPAVLKELKAIQDELTELETNPDAAFTRQKNVLAEQHATLKLKREWESRLSVVNSSVMSRLDTALDSGGDKSQKTEVKRIVEMAVKAVKDKKDYERGLRLLTQAEGRVAQIERNPEGTALGDRKALPKHVESYSANVIKLRHSLENFVTQAVEQAKGKPELQGRLREALNKQVGPLTLQLNPGLFAAPLKTLLGEDVPSAKRREAREQALERLRETVGFITTQPTMVKLAANPVVPLMSDMRALDASLTRLEAHLRASVR
jgi:hypothetical protein